MEIDDHDQQHSGLLVIGVGNRDRGDDGAGPLVADAVRASAGDRIRTFVAEGDLSDLALRWTATDNVVIVDAMVSGRPPGSIVETDGLASELPVEETLLSSHGVGLGEAVELARLLGRLPRRLTIIGVEAKTFEQFDPVSDEVAAAIPDVANRLVEGLPPGSDGSILRSSRAPEV